MNLEVERYEGELRVLRSRVKELEKEVSYMQNELRTFKPTWEKKTIEQDNYF
tara:strand:- start:7156 stop:7311 length:156 start_codon:yes stop_codon:yes gene_type:complete